MIPRMGIPHTRQEILDIPFGGERVHRNTIHLRNHSQSRSSSHSESNTEAVRGPHRGSRQQASIFWTSRNLKLKDKLV